MLKITGCLMMAAACTLAGYLKSLGLYRRRDFLKSFIIFLNSLATHIRYDSSDIFTLISLSSDDMPIPLGEELSAVKNNSDKEIYKPFSALWEEMVYRLPKSCSLNDSDRKMLIGFGEKLGVTDSQGQLKHIELYKAMSEKQLAYAEEDILKKSKLYRTMGFFAGAAAALMFI